MMIEIASQEDAALVVALAKFAILAGMFAPGCVNDERG